MKDNEIIKAVEYCLAQGITSECERCRDKIGCRDTLLQDALDLINRQKTEIERLKYLLDYEEKQYDLCAKRFFKEGVKEFAERLKERYFDDKDIVNMLWVKAMEHIDNLLEEMEERE